jgi:polysaccharide biosynthesis transport protein
MSSSRLGHGRGGHGSDVGGQSLIRYYLILRERVWLIVACTLLVLAAAVVYVVVAPRTYQATAELEVQATNPNDAVLSTLPLLHQTGDPTEDVLTGASLVTTPRVATMVAQALQLRTTPAALLGDVTASPIGQAGLVAVQATASSPTLAMRLANAFVNNTVAASTATMHAAITAELPTITKQLAAVPAGQRYGPGSIGQQLDELQGLLLRNAPTLSSAASATLPVSPSSPRTKLTLVAGLLGGLLLGIGAAFTFHMLDPRMRREEQLRELFGVPVLARIPREAGRNRTTRPLLPVELSVTSHEGYRRLRTTLATRGQPGASQAYLVTGSAPGEGKTTTAISLAVALAQSGGRVILIEADIRRPTFASLLGLEVSRGIEHVMIGETTLAEALVMIRIDDTSLYVLPAEQAGVELADRMSYLVARKLIEDAKAIADYVVIDSPPLTAVIDALPFAQLSDEVLIVARFDRSRLGRLAELEELLREHGAAATGLVLVGDAPVGGRETSSYYYEAAREGNGSRERGTGAETNGLGPSAPEPDLEREEPRSHRA